MAVATATEVGAGTGAAKGASKLAMNSLNGLLGGSLLGGLFGGSSSKDMNSAYDKSMEDYLKYMQKAEDEFRQHEAQGRTDITGYLKEAQGYTEPYRNAGTSALESYMGSLGLGGGEAQQSAYKSFQTTPGYQFALNQGLNSVNANASAGGYGQSGAEQKALLNYGQGMANQEYGNWQNKLFGLSGMGQQSAENSANRSFQTGGLLANQGQQYAHDYGTMYGNIAQAQAEADIAKAQAAAKAKSSGAAGAGGLLGGITGAFGF
jgi:hypothetical protein